MGLQPYWQAWRSLIRLLSSLWPSTKTLLGHPRLRRELRNTAPKGTRSRKPTCTQVASDTNLCCLQSMGLSHWVETQPRTSRLQLDEGRRLSKVLRTYGDSAVYQNEISGWRA